VIKQTPARLPGHYQVKIAIFICFTTGDRAENAQVSGGSPRRNAQDFIPAF